MQVVFTMDEYLSFMDVIESIKEDGLSPPEVLLVDALEKAKNEPVTITIVVT